MSSHASFSDDEDPIDFNPSAEKPVAELTMAEQLAA
jgi:hypothetical protein